MKKTFIAFIIMSIGLFSAFLGFEPCPMLAATSGDSFTTSLTVTSEISITDCPNINLGSIGLAADAAIGSTTCSVNTTNATGYYLTVAASTSPALKSGSNYFSDVSTTTMPDEWADRAPTVTNVFGFSIFGANVNTGIWGTQNGSYYCGNVSTTDVTNSNMKWYGFYTTATTTLTTSTSTLVAMPFTLCVAAEQGSSANAPSGAYYSTSTVTAATN
jgi:hypothetical protein